MATSKPFVKAAKTSTQVTTSKVELETMLRRYGATGFSVQQTFDDHGRPVAASVQFIIPDAKGSKQKVPVSLPIDVRRVYDSMYGRPTKQERIPDAQSWPHYRTVHDPAGYNAAKLEQAERVAWRNLIVWIDAALSAASIGLQTITEALYAHAVVHLPDGRNARMAEVVEAMQGQLPAGVRALLASAAEEV